MKIETWEIYWIFKLDDIHGWLEGVTLLLGFICCLLVIFSFVGTTLCLDGTDSDKKVKSRLYKATLFAFILFLFVSIGNVFLPTTKQMVAIKVLPAIVNSESVQKGLPDELSMFYSITKEFFKKKMVDEVKK